MKDGPKNLAVQKNLFGIQAKFEQFHRDNPHIYKLLVTYARQVLAAGRKRYSIGCIYERIRWHLNIETKSGDDFKLNNNFRSRYARLIIAQEPDLRELFECRMLTEERNK